MPDNKGCLYLDFGATRIKWVLEPGSGKAGNQTGELSNPYIYKDFFVEIDLKKLADSIKKLIYGLHTSYGFNSIMISSQMHGFAIISQKGEWLTNYISWMDQRFYNLNKSEYTSFIKNYSGLFSEKTGMPVKTGLPYFNSISVLKKLKEKEVTFMSLPEIVLSVLGAKNFGVHSTMLAGSGFYDIYKKEISPDLLKIHRKATGKDILFNAVSQDFDYYTIKINDSFISISIGFGDHQCSVLGAENDLNSVSLNLGTGSQVSQIIPQKKIASVKKKPFLQKRPFFGSDYLVCITHIPSGRVLKQFVELFSGPGLDRDVWSDIHNLTLKDLKKSTLQFDLSVFNDAWGYSAGGSISHIHDGELNYTNYVSSLIRSYISQYSDIVNLFDANLGTADSRVILSGGVAQRIPVIKKALSEKLSKKIVQKKVAADKDEAVVGLKKIYGLRHP